MSGMVNRKLETEKEAQRRQEKRTYLEVLPEYPDFILPNDEIDALLPSARVKSWQDLLKILQGPDFKRTKNDLVYRGHAGHDWQLASTLGRLFDGGDIPSEKREKLFRQFKLSMRGRGYDLAPLQGDSNEIWAVGQHYGLKTPLLDWTRSPFVALFFAFSKYENLRETEDNPSRAIFCLNKTKIEEDLGEEFADELFFEPEDSRNSRLVNQSGLFTVAPEGKDNFVSSIVNRLDASDLLGSVDQTETRAEDRTEDPQITFTVSDRKRASLLAQYIFKLHIPNSIDARKDCLEALRQMNIHHGNLFPDPGGASDFCNDWLERLIEEERLDKATEIRQAEDKRVAKAVTVKPDGNILGDVKTILEAYIEFKNDEADSFASDVDGAVENASSIDWEKFPARRVLVKRAISKAIAQGSGQIKAGRKVETLIGLLLEKYQTAASGGNE